MFFFKINFNLSGFKYGSATAAIVFSIGKNGYGGYYGGANTALFTHTKAMELKNQNALSPFIPVNLTDSSGRNFQ